MSDIKLRKLRSQGRLQLQKSSQARQHNTLSVTRPCVRAQSVLQDKTRTEASGRERRPQERALCSLRVVSRGGHTSSRGALSCYMIIFFQKTEEWEKNKCEEDMAEYEWERSSSERSVVQTLLQMRASEGEAVPSREELLRSAEAEEYRRCVVRLKKEGETEAGLAQYKEAAKRLLGLA